jgi:predicted DNA-binding transcriptional regulator YafY
VGYPRGRAKSCGGLLILIGLATRHFGLTVNEMATVAKVSRRAVFRHIVALERMGVEITRKREPVRASWRTIYKLAGIKGMRFKIERGC